jgi:hypothetical protein
MTPSTDAHGHNLAGDALNMGCCTKECELIRKRTFDLSYASMSVSGQTRRGSYSVLRIDAAPSCSTSCHSD